MVAPNDDDQVTVPPVSQISKLPSSATRSGEASKVQRPASGPIADPAIVSFDRPAPAAARTGSFATATLTSPFNSLPLPTETAELATTIRDEGGDEDPRAHGFHRSVQGHTSLTVDSHAVKPQSSRGPTGRDDGRKKKPGPQGQELDASELDPSASRRAQVQQKKKSAKRFVESSRKQRARALEAQNGWATEDATDIQEGGDFDFEANLSKFDKSQVFQQLKENDKVDSNMRLVSHNRLLSKPGTAGGKNLHWTENVLESPRTVANDIWTRQAGTSDDSDDMMSSSRNLQRNVVRLETRKLSTRSNGGWVDLGLPDIRRLSTSNSRGPTSGVPGSPKSRVRAEDTTPFSNTTASSTLSQPAKPSLRIIDNAKKCPCLSPLQLLELEQKAISTRALSDAAMTENAGRGIAEAVLKCLGSSVQVIAIRLLFCYLMHARYLTALSSLDLVPRAADWKLTETSLLEI